MLCLLPRSSYMTATLAAALWLLSYTPLTEAATATATVTYTLATITVISVSGNPATMTISTATPGSGPTMDKD